MEEKSQEMTKTRQTLLSPRVEELKDTLPPPLDFSTDLDTIGDEWWAERDRQQEHCRTTGNQSPCVMAWVAGPEVGVILDMDSSLYCFVRCLQIRRDLCLFS